MATKRKAAKRSAAARRRKRSARAEPSRRAGAKKGIAGRAAAMLEAPFAVCESDKKLQDTLQALRDQNQPSRVRLAALQTLQTASFQRQSHSSHAAAITSPPCARSWRIRIRRCDNVCSVYWRDEKDGFAQKKLLDGLQNPDKALVPPEKALQMLSNDVHAEAYPIARAIVRNPPNPDARREALRLLAADAAAAPLFESVLRDKDELREIRQIAASALQALRPEKMRDARA